MIENCAKRVRGAFKELVPTGKLLGYIYAPLYDNPESLSRRHVLIIPPERLKDNTYAI